MQATLLAAVASDIFKMIGREYFKVFLTGKIIIHYKIAPSAIFLKIAIRLTAPQQSPSKYKTAAI